MGILGLMLHLNQQTYVQSRLSEVQVQNSQSEFEYDLWRSHHPSLSSQPQTWQIWLRLGDRHFPQIFLMIGSQIRHRDRVLNMLLG